MLLDYVPKSCWMNGKHYRPSSDVTWVDTACFDLFVLRLRVNTTQQYHLSKECGFISLHNH